MRRIVASFLLLALLLAGCGGTQGQASPAPASVAPSVPASIAAQASSAPSAQAAPSADEFVNPVIDQDFPDPDTLKVGDTYYAYATNAAGRNVQVARSTDLVQWETLLDALPLLPGWATGGFTWAPEVAALPDGSYIMYYTARDTASNKQCIGAATSDAPEGPFEDTSDVPFICQLDEGGSIDAATFADDDGTRYVLWKNDGNCCGQTTYIYLQPVSDDGLTLEGEPTRLIENDQSWEGNVIEAPTLWNHDGRYYLFYSANSYAGPDYAIGYAVADAVTGPYEKPLTEPWVATDLNTVGAIGPGGQDILVAPDGETWLMYHSWDNSAAYRGVQIDELVWNDGTPTLDGPERTPQPRP